MTRLDTIALYTVGEIKKFFFFKNTKELSIETKLMYQVGSQFSRARIITEIRRLSRHRFHTYIYILYTSRLYTIISRYNTTTVVGRVYVYRYVFWYTNGSTTSLYPLKFYLGEISDERAHAQNKIRKPLF